MRQSLIKVFGTVAVAGAALGGAFGVGVAVAKPPAAPTTSAYSDMKWESPMGEGGPQVSPLWGDMKKAGDTGFLLKLPAGFVSPMHSHTNDYWAVTIQGSMSHWSDAQTEKDAIALPAGSYTMMPGKMKHTSKCA